MAHRIRIHLSIYLVSRNWPYDPVEINGRDGIKWYLLVSLVLSTSQNGENNQIQVLSPIPTQMS